MKRKSTHNIEDNALVPLMTKILKFTAEWCRSCKLVDPICREEVEKHSFEEKFFIKRHEQDEDDFRTHRITSIPTLLFFHDEEEKIRIESSNEEEIRNAFADFKKIIGREEKPVMTSHQIFGELPTCSAASIECRFQK